MTRRPANAALLRRVELTWARDAAAFAEVLAASDPSWGAITFPFAGGHAVLCGPGMYVNRAMAVAIDGPIGAAELDEFEARCRAVGVAPAIDITPVTDPGVAGLLAARGYAPHDRVTALVHRLDDLDPIDDDGPFVVQPVDDTASLATWQETSAAGWGHVDPEARRVSDAFTRAAWAIDGAGMVVARDPNDGLPVGVASLTVRDGVGTLGGMSTVPAARRRGVQAALVRYRLSMASARGCDLAAVTAATGGDSERNLERLGFAPVAVHVTWRQRPAAPSAPPRT